MKTFEQEIPLLDQCKIYETEKNDCFVLSIAAATKCPYWEAHHFVERFYRREKEKGIYFRKVLKRTQYLQGYCFFLGNSFYKIKPINRELSTIRKFKQEVSSGVYILHVHGHALAYKNGVIIDHPENLPKKGRKILDALEFIPLIST